MTFEEAESRAQALAGPKACAVTYSRTHYSRTHYSNNSSMKQECSIYIADAGSVMAETWLRAFELIRAKINREPEPMEGAPGEDTTEPAVNVVEKALGDYINKEGNPGLDKALASAAELYAISQVKGPMIGMSKLVEILTDQLGIDKEQVVPEASLVDDLGCDSLDLVELVMAFGEELNTEITDEVAEQLSTVGAIIQALKMAGRWQE